jgi:serine/threonine-protein kinase RsbW
MSAGRNGMFTPRSTAGGTRARMAVVAFPVDKDYLGLARLATMHIAGLLGLSLSRVADLRLAVDEACTTFMTDHGAGRDGLELSFERYPLHLCVTVRGPAPARWPRRDGIGWMMLEALVGEARATVAGDVGTLTLIEPLGVPMSVPR